MIDRLLIVGLGSIGRRHLRLARSLLPRARICVMRHQKTDEVPEWADEVCCTLDEALAFKPMAAVIANPAPFHAEVALPLARAGIHLLIEKPVGTDSSQIDVLQRVCVDAGVTAMTAYNLRFLPSLQKVRELLAAGHVGKVLSVRGEMGQYLPSWRPHADYRQGVSARKVLGGGVLFELSHELDYLRWLCGDVTWVQATLLKASDLDIDVEDTAHLVLGLNGMGDGVRSGPLVATINIDFVRHDTTRCVTFIGEAGSLRWNALDGRVDVCMAGQTGWETLAQLASQRDDSYIAEWQHWLQCIDLGAPCAPSIGDGLQVLRIIEAARASAAAAGRCDVPMPKRH
ncbi:MAG: Gfo/Idh/MocA family oxidoreductase [Aquabacterium sp.]